MSLTNVIREEAKSACESEGAALPVLHTKDDLAAMEHFAQSQGGKIQFPSKYC